MIERADKFFGVYYRGDSSHIQEIEKEKATDFVIDGAIQN